MKTLKKIIVQKQSFKVVVLLFAMFFSVQLIAQTNSNYANGEKIPCEEITIGCRIVRGGDKYVIKNEIEYQNFLQSKQSSLLQCAGNEHPVIDFTKYTLLGIDQGIIGCQEPSTDYTIFYDQQQNSYMFELKITSYGFCKRNNMVKIWCLIPKISENALVDFNFIYKNLPDENENK